MERPLISFAELLQVATAAARSGAKGVMRFFQGSFRVVPATSNSLRDKVHRLRYQVYCVENAFEDPAQHSDGRETDEFDERAAHSLLVHSPTNIPVGCVRLIAHHASPFAVRLPIHGACPNARVFDSVCPAPNRLAEISRFCLSKDALKAARRAAAKSNDDARPAPGAGDGSMSGATLGLIAAIIAMAAAGEVSHVCALMAPPLLRLLAQFGIHFAPIGPLVDFHGLRQPVYSDLGELLARVHRLRPDIWALITGNGELWPLSGAGTPQLGAVA